MLPILNTAQIKQLDQNTIDQEPITSIDLMERACKAFTEWFVQRYRNSCKVGIICGTGNNGGDGLGIARLLVENQYQVKVWIIRDEARETTDFKASFERTNGNVGITEILTSDGVPSFEGCHILIDAIFGSGLSRPVQGLYESVIQKFNEAKAIKIAVDIPSGLRADQPSTGEIIMAHRTLSFQLPKLAFLLPQNYPFVGEWTILDIGLNKQFLLQADPNYFLVERTDAVNILRPRTRFSHKGNFGHALLIAGSRGKMGASILSSRAALRSGVGLLTVHVPKTGNDILQGAVPEAMTSIDTHENYFSSIPDTLNYSAIGIGPGIGKDPKTVAAFHELMKAYHKPMVIDADALNILAANRELITCIHPESILTPHPKEFERLVGTWMNDFERLEKLQKLSLSTKSAVILKGAFTSIALPNGKVYFNSTGNPGMATGGSGDVLTGILTGLMAQGYSFDEAAILGVYLHGLAGDLAIQELDMNSLIASDLIDFLPKAFRNLQKEK